MTIQTPQREPLELVNLSNWNGDELRSIIEWIISDLEIREPIKFIFQSVWTEISDDGHVVPGTERDLAYDGDWTEGGIVRVAISDRISYPHIWEINALLPGLYLRRTNTFHTPAEFFIYFAAHELRHQYQEENPKKVRQICKLLKIDDETDADIYATLVLCKFRAAAAASEKVPQPEVQPILHPFLRARFGDDEEIDGYEFWCPGCASIDPSHGLHVFTVKDPDGDSDLEWEFNGVSSFEPSLAYESNPACHLHLTGGWLRYYLDCAHALAGQDVEMVPIPAGEHEERD